MARWSWTITCGRRPKASMPWAMCMAASQTLACRWVEQPRGDECADWGWFAACILRVAVPTTTFTPPLSAVGVTEEAHEAGRSVKTATAMVGRHQALALGPAVSRSVA